ncbi:ATPase family AAA domain-containing protein 1-B-like [Trypanosoma conorhini]|uniref:ATPase family AAA domain-containing protein 1-B-like n=1 Tax=Trypanosoma conorhini TaxID=83891 RepID=A0A422NBD8_9TRYP|nr:ATPase family AAA domain-containing protein 1-B-like [Trypanosoma conorhini]RNF02762.1 ATPase family AAA domain-containing protein 1-B-like [Trypanosoma conorhini]
MTCWDGIAQSDAKIVVIGATNRPEFVDEAIRRRLPLKIEVPPPDEKCRRKILKVLLEHDLKDNPNKENIIEFVTAKTARYTGSDLTELCKAAALIPLHEIVEDGVVPPLEICHFEKALQRVQPSL